MTDDPITGRIEQAAAELRAATHTHPDDADPHVLADCAAALVALLDRVESLTTRLAQQVSELRDHPGLRSDNKIHAVVHAEIGTFEADDARNGIRVARHHLDAAHTALAHLAIERGETP